MTEQPLTIRQLAELLQVSERTVQRNVPNWPHLKIGPRTIRFTETHIEQILTSHDKQPQAPRPSRRRRQI